MAKVYNEDPLLNRLVVLFLSVRNNCKPNGEINLIPGITTSKIYYLRKRCLKGHTSEEITKILQAAGALN